MEDGSSLEAQRAVEHRADHQHLRMPASVAVRLAARNDLSHLDHVHLRLIVAPLAELERKQRLDDAKDGAHNALQHRVRRLDALRRGGEAALVPRDQGLAEARQEDVLEGDEACSISIEALQRRIRCVDALR